MNASQSDDEELKYANLMKHMAVVKQIGPLELNHLRKRKEFLYPLSTILATSSMKQLTTVVFGLNTLLLKFSTLNQGVFKAF